jgi:hypothetical protein
VHLLSNRKKNLLVVVVVVVVVGGAAWVVVVVGGAAGVVAKHPSANINCWAGRRSATKAKSSNDTSRVEVTVATVREGNGRKQLRLWIMQPPVGVVGIDGVEAC